MSFYLEMMFYLERLHRYGSKFGGCSFLANPVDGHYVLGLTMDAGETLQCPHLLVFVSQTKIYSIVRCCNCDNYEESVHRRHTKL